MDREPNFHWNEIEPLCVLRLLKKKLWLILLAALIGFMSCSIVMTLRSHPSSGCSVTFVVSSRMESAAGTADVSAASQAAATYSSVLTNRLTRDTIDAALGRKIDYTLSATQLGETNLLQMDVQTTSPRDALQIMQALLDSREEISSYITTSAVLTVFNPPKLVSSAGSGVNNRTCMLTALGFAAAMILLLSWMSLSSGTIQSRLSAKNNLDAKVFTTIPHEGKFDRSKRSSKEQKALTIHSPLVSFGFTESMHRIAVQLECERSKGRQIFLFTSVTASEGKSTVTANTALSLASKGAKVLLIDLDLRRPVQHILLSTEVPQEHEFGSLMSANLTAREILGAALPVKRTSVDALLSTRSYVKVIERLSSQLLYDIMQLARQHYDYILVDTPPLGYFTDSEILSDLADASLLVVRQDTVPAPVINDSIDALRAGRSQFLGCILNDMRHLAAGSSSYGYGYGGKYYGKYSRYKKYGAYGQSEGSHHSHGSHSSHHSTTDS